MSKERFFIASVLMLILGTISSCFNPTSLGIKNKRHFKYSKEEIKKAAILSISAKLEKQYHSAQKEMDHESLELDLNEKSKQEDFLRRLKENE